MRSFARVLSLAVFSTSRWSHHRLGLRAWLAAVVGVWLALTPAQASAVEQCRELFQVAKDVSKNIGAQPLFRFPEQSLFNENEIEKVRSLLTQDPRPAGQRWSDITNIYLQARLRYVPAEFQSFARKSLNRLRPRFTERNEVVAGSNDLNFPREYENTPLPYLLLVHEWEHLLRAINRSGGLNSTAGGFNYKLNPFETYVEEGGAMSAEWEIARLVSDQDASSLVELSNRMSDEKRFKTMVQTMMVARGLSRSQYVAVIRESGRYSFGDALKKVGARMAVTVTLVASGAGSATLIFKGAAMAVSGTCTFVSWILH